MKIKFKIILSVLLIALLFSSCSSTQTLKQLAITEGMAVDKTQSGMSVTVQILNLAKNGTSESLSGNITMNATEEGGSVSDAVSKLSKAVSKKLFFGQNKLIVFGSSIATNGVGNHLDYFVRSTDSRPDVLLAVGEKDAKEILESKENDSLVPSESITGLMKNGERSGLGAYVTVNDAMCRYCSETADMYLPVLNVEKESVRVKGLGLFNEDKMTAVTDDEETMGILLMDNKVSDGLLLLNDKKLGTVGVEIVENSTKLGADMENGRVVFHVKMKSELMLDETEKGITGEISKSEIENIERLAEDRITTICLRAFMTAQTANSDCLRVGDYLKESDYSTYKTIRKDWVNYYRNADISVNASCRISKINDNSIRE